MADDSALVALRQVGMTDAQLAQLAQLLAPGLRQTDSFATRFEQFLERAAANGFQPEVAGWWANELATVGGPLLDEADHWLHELVDHLNNGAGLSSTEAAKLAREGYTRLADLQRPSGAVIDTTSVTVPESRTKGNKVSSQELNEDGAV